MEKKFPTVTRNLLVSKIKEYSNHPQNLEKVEPFLEDVDKEEYRDYCKHIPYETCFLRILDRFEKNIYHSL